jgi:hypothetical protein
MAGNGLCQPPRALSNDFQLIERPYSAASLQYDIAFPALLRDIGLGVPEAGSPPRVSVAGSHCQAYKDVFTASLGGTSHLWRCTLPIWETLYLKLSLLILRS